MVRGLRGLEVRVVHHGQHGKDRGSHLIFKQVQEYSIWTIAWRNGNYWELVDIYSWMRQENTDEGEGGLG